MFCATLIISGREWLWVAGGAALAAAAVLLWGYRHAPPSVAARLGPALKLFGVLALVSCLLEPLWSGQRARPGANLFAVLADNSQSLNVKAPGGKTTRAESLRRLVIPAPAGWQSTLEENFDLRRYSFDARLQAVRDFSSLDFEGGSSAIGLALRTLAERYRNRPLAGVLLLSDGNATDLRAANELSGLPPVYPVLVGSAEPVPDIAIQQVNASETAFEDVPVRVQAEVLATSCRGSDVRAELLDASGRSVGVQTLRARSDRERLAFGFTLKPDNARGVAFYRLHLRLDDGPAGQGSSREATLANNEAVVTVDRGRGPCRILYVSGRPNWEFKFLRRALESDPQLQMVALIRIARREPKFNFLGRAGETSNPLYRGFGDQSPEEIERYDQPVLVRLNTRDDAELRGGFPRTAEELFAYHAVVIDDLEAEFFTPDQAQLLQRFVSERGGGFLMLGGMECFRQGGYQRTPIGELLPVYLDRGEPTRESGPWRIDLAREGWLQPWVRLRENEADEKARLAVMPSFRVVNALCDVKPGASVMATLTSAQGGVHPALVTQRFGRGTAAALTIGDFWQWGMADPDLHSDMDKGWRQLVRHLVKDVPQPVEIVAKPDPESVNGATVLEVRVRDPKFEPLDNASVAVEVRSAMPVGTNAADPNVIRLLAETSLDAPGLYRATFVPRLAGGYLAVATVTNGLGVPVGQATTGWSRDAAAEEFRSLAPNISLLEAVARQTGGRVVDAGGLDAFARRLPLNKAPVMESWTFPVWHTPLMFAFALACLAGEWGLRRWKGLP